MNKKFYNFFSKKWIDLSLFILNSISFFFFWNKLQYPLKITQILNDQEAIFECEETVANLEN
jgi:hypothetical protein